MNKAEELWERHEPKSGYPAGVLPVPKPIIGTAFFPGGYGLWNPKGTLPLPVFPIGGVMVLGHDFHSENGYRKSLDEGRERMSQPTWRNLLKILRTAEIRPEDCFFTNVYMGLRAGTAKTGVFPGASNDQFVQHCLSFLRVQIATQRPSLIITLGKYAPLLLASLSPDLSTWAERSGFKHLDKSEPVRHGVTFAQVPEYSASVVALLHPSLRAASLRHREYKGLKKEEAEALMLKEARLG